MSARSRVDQELAFLSFFSFPREQVRAASRPKNWSFLRSFLSCGPAERRSRSYTIAARPLRRPGRGRPGLWVQLEACMPVLFSHAARGPVPANTAVFPSTPPSLSLAVLGRAACAGSGV